MSLRQQPKHTAMTAQKAEQLKPGFASSKTSSEGTGTQLPPATSIDQLEYLADMIDEMRLLADKSQLPGVALLLKVARDEAHNQRRLLSARCGDGSAAS